VGSDAAKATVVEVNKPVSTDPGKAPSVDVIAGAAVAPVAQGLPSSSTFTTEVSVNGRSGILLGTIKSDTNGKASIPAFQTSESGTYSIKLTDQTGRAFFLQIAATASPSGVGLLSDSDLANASTVVVNAPVTPTVTNAPSLTVPVNTPVVPEVGGLPANTVVQVDVSANPRARAKATFVRIGSSRTNAKGRVKLPAFKASQPGSFVLRLKTPAGKTYFLKVKVAGTSSAKPASKPASKPVSKPAA